MRIVCAVASVALRLTVQSVVAGRDLGNFSLQAAQTPPLNAFVNREELATAAGLKGKINMFVVGDYWGEWDDEMLIENPKRFQKMVSNVRSKLPQLFHAKATRQQAPPWFTAHYAGTKLKHEFRLKDLGLSLRTNSLSNSAELVTDRIFLDSAIVAAALPTTA